MTLDKAIAILSICLTEGDKVSSRDIKETIDLGIEAMKIVKFTRENNFRMPLGLLPGETEE